MKLWRDYFFKQRDDQIALARSRNYSRRASASALPQEILAGIFRYVLAGSGCGHWGSGNPRTPTSYPELLSHVCFSWRWAAINSPDLWIHIDLSTSFRLTLRAKAYLERSGQLPLYVHILGWLLFMGHRKDETHADFILALAPRAKSIYFDQHEPSYEDSTLKSFLENCTPGILTQITMRHSHGSKKQQFIVAQGQEALGCDTLRIDASEQHLEDTMLGLTIFRSGGTCALWDSKAYHNLTDLRLNNSPVICQCSIPESQLVAILNSSPRLSSIEIGFKITDALPTTASVKPVHLVDLERLQTRNKCRTGMLLRWINPGLKSLRLMLTSHKYNRVRLDPFLKEQLQSFLLRSNTTSAMVDVSEHYSVVASFFSTTDSIKELAIDSPGSWREHHNFDIECAGPPLRIDTLYLLGDDCKFGVENLSGFLEAQMVQNTVVWGGVFYEEAGQLHTYQRRISEKEASKRCPKAIFLSRDDPNPVEDWHVHVG